MESFGAVTAACQAKARSDQNVSLATVRTHLVHRFQGLLLRLHGMLGHLGYLNRYFKVLREYVEEKQRAQHRVFRI